MRNFINIIENDLSKLDEIEIGGEVDRSYLDSIRQTDYNPDQLSLFKDIPTLQPKLPKDYEEVGRLGTYYIACTIDDTTKYGDEKTYVVFDGGIVAGAISVIPPEADFGDYGGRYHAVNPPVYGKGLRVVSVMLDKRYRGQNLSISLYEWLLKNVCDYILPDDMQTPGGVFIWKKLLNSRRFDVLVYDVERDIVRKRRSGKDFNQVYKTNNLRPFVILAGRYDELCYPQDDDV